MRAVPELAPVTPAQQAAIRAAPPTPQAHRALMAGLPGLNAVQTGGATPEGRVLPAEFTVLAWNLERCLFPEDSAAHVAPRAPSVILLSEMDHGMARTGQRHTTKAMAAALGMAYAFGVEFYELALGGPVERSFCTDTFNALGWHGNAILSAVPFEAVTMIRLDDAGLWFTEAHGEPRIGGRNAIAARLPGAAGPLCVVSTHLESNADAQHRATQFDTLMDAVDAFAPGLPVVIGGDLNTGNHMPPDYDWRGEPLFARARARGYDWSFTAPGLTTGPSLITRHPERRMKLDWICARGLACTGCGILPAHDPQGRPLSDHHPVWAEVAAPAQPR